MLLQGGEKNEREELETGIEGEEKKVEMNNKKQCLQRVTVGLGTAYKASGRL